MVGLFKDDCFQNHNHSLSVGNGTNASGQQGAVGTNVFNSIYVQLVNDSFRAKDVTRGKSKGVKYIIKIL